MSNTTVGIRLALEGAQVVSTGVDQVSDKLDQVGKSADRASIGSDRMAQALGKVAHYGLAGGGMVALATSAQAAGQALFEASASAQRLQTQLNFATGGNSAKEMAFVTGVANQLGLQLASTAQAYAGFASAARGTSLEGTKTRQVFESIAQASAVMGLSADQSAGALLAIQQMMSKGVVSAEEFRGQLGERMPIALQAGANALGVTTAEFSKMLESGQIIAADFLPKFAVAIKEMLGDSVEAAASRLEASTARMGNAWERFKRTVGDSGVSKAIANDARTLAAYVDSLSDAMDAAAKNGSGTIMQISAAAGTMIARLPFDTAAASANLFNGALNALSLGALGLNTNIDLLPVSLRSVAEQSAILPQRLAAAQAELAALQERLKQNPDSPYLKSQAYQAFLLVQQLQAAQKAKDNLAGGGAGRGNVNPQSIEQMGAAQNKLAEAMEKYASKGEKATKVIEELRKAHGALFTPEMERKVRAQLDPIADSSADAFAADRTAMAAWAKAVEDSSAAVSKATAANDGLTETERKLRDYLASSAALRAEELVPGINQHVVAAYKQAIATEAQTAATKAEEKATLAAAEARVKYNSTLGTDLEKLQKETQAQQDFNARLGLSKDAIAALDAAKLEEQATTLEGLAIKAMDRSEDMVRYELYKAQAAELRKLIALKKDGATKETAIDELKKTQEEAKRLGEQLEGIISDGLMRGFENGKTFAENFRDVLENTFKTMILRPMVQATVQGALGMGTDKNSGFVGGIGSNIGSGAMNLVGLAGVGTAFSGAMSSGYALAAGGNALATMGAGASMVGSATGFTSAAAGIGQITGAAAAGVQTALAAIPGWGWAAMAVLAIANMKGEYVKGIGVNSSFDSSGNLTGRVRPGNVGESSAASDNFTDSLANSYALIAKKFDAKLKATTFGFQTSSDGKFDVSTTVGGNVAFQQGTTAISEGAMGLAASRAVFAALQASELPGYLSKAFTGIVANTATADQIAGAYAFADSLKAVRFGLLTAKEQTAEYQKVIDEGTAALGTTAEKFNKDFIAAIDKGLTPEGLAQWSALGGTMQALEQITGKTAAGLDDVGRSLKDIANERKGLQDTLDSLTLSNAQLLEKQRNALDESNRALFDQVQTAQAAKTAADALAESQANLASTNASLQERLDLLTGARTQRDIEFASATDSSTKALLNQIYAAEDLKTAQEAAATATQKLSEKLAAFRLASDRLSVNTAVLGGASPQQAALLDAQIGVSNGLKDLETFLRGAGDRTTVVTEQTVSDFLQSGRLSGESLANQINLTPLLNAVAQAIISRNAAQTALTNSNTAPVVPVVPDTSAADAAAALERTNAPLRDQLALLLGTQTDRSIKLRDAVDATTKSLLEQIFAQEDLKAAADAAAAIAKEAGTLADRLAVATGSKTSQQVQRANELAAALNDQNRATLQAIYAAEDLTAAYEKQLQAAKEATGAAFSGVQRAIDAQKKIVQAQLQVAQESVSNLTSIFDTLKGGIKSLQADSEGNRATAFLNDALATAKATGYLPDAGDLADAVSAAISSTQAGVYASQADAEFAKLALAGTLTGLQDITGTQLTAAEQAVKLAEDQLTALDKTLENAQAQLDAMNGIDTSVKSVADAMAALATAIANQQGITAAGSGASTVSGTFGNTTVGTFAGQTFTQDNRAFGGIGLAGELEAIRVAQQIGESPALALYKATYNKGSSTELWNKVLSESGYADTLSIPGVREFLRDQGVPGFAVGTNYVPNDMLAMIHKGEAIVPAAYNPAASGSGSSRTDTLIEGLTAEVKRLQEFIAITNANTRRTADAVNGNPDAPILVTTVA